MARAMVLFLFLQLILQHAAGDRPANGPQDAVVHLVAGEAACRAAG